MSQAELAGVTSEDYTEVAGSHPMWYRVFQAAPGSSEYYLRLVIDFASTHDAEHTFGPLDADGVDRLAQVLAGTYCHYNENHEGPIYESGIAQGLVPSRASGGGSGAGGGRQHG
jgi:hypothetical protein